MVSWRGFPGQAYRFPRGTTLADRAIPLIWPLPLDWAPESGAPAEMRTVVVGADYLSPSRVGELRPLPSLEEELAAAASLVPDSSVLRGPKRLWRTSSARWRERRSSILRGMRSRPPTVHLLLSRRMRPRGTERLLLSLFLFLCVVFYLLAPSSVGAVLRSIVGAGAVLLF